MGQNDIITTTTTTYRFAFTRKACLQDGMFSSFNENNNHNNNNTMTLVRNKNNNTTQCTTSMGIHATHDHNQPHLQSNTTMESFFTTTNHKNHDETKLEIELWLELDDTTLWNDSNEIERKSIMTLASNKNNNKKNGYGLSICDQLGIDLQLYQQHDESLFLIFRTTDQFIEPCQTLRIDLNNNNTRGMTHILIQLQDKKQQVFVNGTMTTTSSRQRLDVTMWNTSTLSLLSYSSPTTTTMTTTITTTTSAWKGILYQLSLSTMFHNVYELIQEGLPDAIPQSQNAHYILHEDAEDVAGSHSNDWYYRTEVPLQDTSRITLPYSSMDKVVQQFQKDHNVTTSKSLPRVYFYLVHLPTIGRLYQVDGSLIQKSSSLSLSSPFNLIPVESIQGELIYIPPLDLYSTDHESITSFEYCVSSDSTIFHSSQCEVISIATIQVLPVNDPPMTYPVPEVVLFEGSRERIQLSGFDKDIGDSIQMIQITQLPKYGHLHLAVNSFRNDHVLHGTPLRTFLQNTIECNNDDGSIYIDYSLSMDQTNNHIIHGKEGLQDSFTFRVQDQGGLWSNEEVVKIRIVSALTGNSTTSIIQQGIGDDNTVILYGSDNSGYDRRISLFVDSIDIHGELLGSHGSIIQAGQLQNDVFNSFPYQNGFAFRFIPSAVMCQGKTEAKTTFLFRVVAFAGNSSQITSTSESFSHTIHLLCQLDQLSLTIPEELVSVQESSLRKISNEYCTGSNSSNEGCSFADINDIQISSSGFRSRRATITVTIPHGFVTLNQASWALTELLHGRRSMGWGNITFKAYPEDLTSIFANLEYQSHKAGEANIQISILFGDCSTEALRTSETNFWTPTCQRLQKYIQIVVIRDPNKYKPKNLVAGSFPWPVLLCMCLYPLIYFWWIQRKSAAAKQFETEFDFKWIQHMDQTSGMFYYEDTINNTTTWQAPIGEPYKPWIDPEV